MANTIKIKTGSGSDPSASDLAVGELALRTDNGKLFSKDAGGSVIELGGGSVSDGAITTAKLANDAVTTAKLADDAVTAAKIADENVGTNALDSFSVTSSKIASNAVGVAKIASNAVTTAKIAADAVTNAKIADDSIDSEHYVDGSIDTAHLANDAVTTAKFQNIDTSRLLGRTSSGSGNVEQLTASSVRTLLNVADGATNVTNNNQLTNGAGYITATLTNEQVQDIVGAMVSGNSESGITVTYQDSDGTLDFSVASQTGSLNASNLDSGTIPDARFPSTLPAISGANLTNLPSSGLSTSGGTLTGTLNARTILPTSNNTFDLGSSSLRWRDIYTNDLNLSNKGGTNDVDGTWGSYTIQEGEEDLFLINRRNGKKYKFNLTEVS